MRARGTTGLPAVGVLALAYLVLLPLGQLLVLPVAGAFATLTDLVLLVLVLGGSLAVLGGLGVPPGEEDLVRPSGGALLGLALLVAFGLWVGASALWSYHPAYAGAKAAGLVMLAAGAWCLGASRVPPARLADAWVVGAAVAMAVTLVVALTGPEMLRERVLYGAGLVDGLPVPRFRGPLVHPNLLGDYLAVTALLLWARWPAWQAGGARSALAVAAAVLVAAGLALSVSSGWLTLGVGAVALAVAAPGWRKGVRVAVAAGGLALAVPTAVGLVGALEIDLGVLVVRTGGIRPALWADAATAVTTSPLLGVGAAPFLAETADPAGGAGTAFWDAHSTYLSVLGQFGVVGGALFFGGLILVARAVYRSGLAGSRSGAAAMPGGDAHHRLTVAVLAAAAGLLVHWTSLAGEESRHVWALVGIMAALTVRSAPVTSPEAS